MTTVELFEDAGFQGDSYVFKSSDKNLANNLMDSDAHFYNWHWDDEASSLKVRDGNVKFFKDADHKGSEWGPLPPGDYDLGDLLQRGFVNDEISSFLFV